MPRWRRGRDFRVGFRRSGRLGDVQLQCNMRQGADILSFTLHTGSASRLQTTPADCRCVVPSEDLSLLINLYSPPSARAFDQRERTPVKAVVVRVLPTTLCLW